MKSVFSHSVMFKISTAFMAVAMVLAILPESPVHAATLTVTSTADTIAVDAVCTLRETIANANSDALTNADCVAGTGNDTIVFNIPLASPTLTLTSSLPIITDVDGLTIDGTNLNALGSTVTISGGGTVRIVSVTAVPNGATFQDLVLANGAVNGNGNAINNTGNLTVNNVTFTSNSTITTATNNGGAIYHNTGTLSINNRTLSLHFKSFIEPIGH